MANMCPFCDRPTSNGGGLCLMCGSEILNPTLFGKPNQTNVKIEKFRHSIKISDKITIHYNTKTMEAIGLSVVTEDPHLISHGDSSEPAVFLGHSKIIDDSRMEHFDSDGKPIGYSLKENARISHYNLNDEQIGFSAASISLPWPLPKNAVFAHSTPEIPFLGL